MDRVLGDLVMFNDTFPFLLTYIDPGTGIVIMQMVIAGIVGVGIFFRRSFLRVFGIFSGCHRKKGTDK